MDLDELVKQGRLKRLFRAKRKLTIPDLYLTSHSVPQERSLFSWKMRLLFMLGTMKDLAKKRSLDIYAFCLMPNHVHVLASPRADGLHEAMRDLFSRYAMRFNKKYERKAICSPVPTVGSVLDDTYLAGGLLVYPYEPSEGGTRPPPFRLSLVVGEAVL